MATEVIMPKVDMDMSHGRVLAWRVKEGQTVEKGETATTVRSQRWVPGRRMRGRGGSTRLGRDPSYRSRARTKRSRPRWRRDRRNGRPICQLEPGDQNKRTYQAGKHVIYERSINIGGDRNATAVTVERFANGNLKHQKTKNWKCNYMIK